MFEKVHWEYSEFLPVLPTVRDLAGCLDADPRLLYRISNHSAEFYTIHTIPKRNGGCRTIEAPHPILKRIQQRILRKILMQVSTHPAATAFEPGRSIRDNAIRHVGLPVVISLDIRNFFPSLKAGVVYAFFRKLGYDVPVAVLLTRLCTLYGHLSQGAPTSPRLSNLLLLPVDCGLAAWIGTKPVVYTRYADDLTLSGALEREDVSEAIGVCRAALARMGLRLNSRKTKVRRRGSRQTVTGLVVNESVRVPRETKRALRQFMYYLDCFGWESCREHFGPGDEMLLDRVIGFVNFMWDMDKTDLVLREWLDRLLLLKLHPEQVPPPAYWAFQ